MPFTDRETSWIGGTDAGHENHWRWESDAKTIVYRNFYKPQPDNASGTEHCLEMRGSGDTATYTWNDNQCETLSKFICEKSKKKRYYIVSLLHIACLYVKQNKRTPFVIRMGDKYEVAPIGNGNVNEGFQRSGEDVEERRESLVLPAITKRRVSYAEGVENKTNTRRLSVSEAAARIRRSSGIPDMENVNVKKEGAGKLLYKPSDVPPPHLLILFGLQQALLSLSVSIILVIVAADFICASDDEEIKSQLLGSTLVLNGISTLAMVLIGVRLPLYQGAYGGYLIPLLTLAQVDPNRCVITPPFSNTTDSGNTTMSDFDASAAKKDLIMTNLRQIQGTLMTVGALHALIGGTGLIGVLLRFIGPITVVPTILLLGIYVAEPTLDFVVINWPISLMTCAVSFILAFYLAGFLMPIPVWTRSKGCHVIRYPIHQVYSMLIAVLFGWFVSWIVTEAGGFTDDKTSPAYQARTDARIHAALDSAKWIFVPYPGMYGTPSFSVVVFFGFLIATIISILDSIGDYYACAAVCHVPPPPKHAVNRGIMMEGICTVLSGAFGCAYSTTTYGPNIGAIGITKVASRSVFVVLAIVYIIFGLLGKFSALFISIPNSVLGGALITMSGMLIGVTLSNMKPIDLGSSRNLGIIGTSILMGLMVPMWVKKRPNDIDTGNFDLDVILKGLLGNPNFTGGVLACFLDNTIPGTKDERGITAWQSSDSVDESEEADKDIGYEEGLDIYDVWLPKGIKKWKGWKYVPFMPYSEDRFNVKTLSDDWSRRKSFVVGVQDGIS
ncbi:hypothetical protein FSP39_012854 [Pinctada imbricata]|uniref:C-type lectin domain-containing protein n=1 Tax=Pinctada imbricata TaxID=66713 RepID=A0AA88YMS3_PINIB|nr:hypothetical protein FSP39_012854 [Pinctada imbricata]